jgi:hypothetical protein
MAYKDPIFIRGLGELSGRLHADPHLSPLPSVIIISVLEVIQWILSTTNAWHYLIMNWGNFPGLSIITRQTLLLTLFSAISMWNTLYWLYFRALNCLSFDDRSDILRLVRTILTDIHMQGLT